jgi:hypothetical protein
MKAVRSHHRRWPLPAAHTLDRHQTNGFQRPMIKTASISFHAASAAPAFGKYNRSVALLTDWLVGFDIDATRINQRTNGHALKSEARDACCALLNGLGLHRQIEKRLVIYGRIHFPKIWLLNRLPWFECDGDGHKYQKDYGRVRDENIAAVTGYRVCCRWNSWYLKLDLPIAFSSNSASDEASSERQYPRLTNGGRPRRGRCRRGFPWH